MLVHLCECETFAELAADFGISIATAWRYVGQTVDVYLVAGVSGQTPIYSRQG